MKFPLKTFAPDVSPITPGILVSVENAYPSETGGLRATPTPSPVSSALAGTVKSSFSFQDVGLSYRHIAATASKLYELQGTGWTDVSNSTTSYGNVDRWRYATWGNWVLATDLNTPMQVQTASLAAFTDLSGSPPQAKYITTVKDFVVLSGLSGAYGNRIQWCALGDATDWSPSLTTQAGYTDLLDTPSPVTAFCRMGDMFVAFKERAMYMGYYSGSPFTWTIQRIPVFSGCVASEAIIELEGMIFYPGIDDFYVFDGTYPKRIGAGIRDWFFGQVNRTYLTNMRVTYDVQRRLIFWWYPTATQGDDSIQECLIYHVDSNRWGRMVQPINEVMNLWRAGITYGTIPDWFPEYIDITNSGLTYGSAFWSSSTFNMGVFGTDNKLAVMTGAPITANLVTGDLGEQVGYSRIRNAWPYFNVEPDACVTLARGKTLLGGAVTYGNGPTNSSWGGSWGSSFGTQPNNLKADGGVDLDLTAKFLSLDMTMYGDFDLIGYDADVRRVSKN